MVHEGEFVAGAIERRAADAEDFGLFDEVFDLVLATGDLLAEEVHSVEAGSAGAEVGDDDVAGWIRNWNQAIEAGFHEWCVEHDGKGAYAAGEVGGEDAVVGGKRVWPERDDGGDAGECGGDVEGAREGGEGEIAGKEGEDGDLAGG